MRAVQCIKIWSSTPIFNQDIFHATMGNESQHTLHTKEIYKVFQNEILWYIGLTIGLILYPIEWIIWNGQTIPNGIHLYSTNIGGICCHKISISFLFIVPFRKCHILIVVLVTKYLLLHWHIRPDKHPTYSFNTQIMS